MCWWVKARARALVLGCVLSDPSKACRADNARAPASLHYVLHPDLTIVRWVKAWLCAGLKRVCRLAESRARASLFGWCVFQSLCISVCLLETSPRANERLSAGRSAGTQEVCVLHELCILLPYLPCGVVPHTCIFTPVFT